MTFILYLLSKRIKPLPCLFVVLCWVQSLSIQGAEDPYALCEEKPPQIDQQTPTELDPNTPAEFTADRAKRDEKGIATLEGAVQMIRGPQTVDADTIRYDENKKHVFASGNVRAEDGQMIIKSNEAELHLDTEYAKSGEASYKYKPLHARGDAENIEKTSEEFVRLENTTYTTCDEGDESWILSADEVELDKSTGDGTGKDVVVKFKGVPIFYTPWIRFPIDDRRKSGFLAPTVGNSNDSGFELETPYYWNMAPNRDAILAPRLLTDRGLQLKSQFRYLYEKSYGQLGLEFLDDDEFKDDRYLVSFEHMRYFTPSIEMDLLYNKVSDDNYFEDLGDGLGLTSTQNIERRGDLQYRGNNWNFLARAQDYQVVDENLPREDEPYARIPQLKLDGDYFDIPGGLNFKSDTEWVSFKHDDNIDGSRLHLGIELERPFEGAGYFIRPSARLMHTEYDLNRRDTLDDKPTRSLPSFNLDAGLIFERNMNRNSNIQTLEPRLYYLHTPFRRQDDIPNFDSTEYEFGFDQLFRNDRFSGTDRIGEADQLSVGLTTRILDLEDGKEKLSASIGRIFFFRDRKVVLPDEQIETDSSSQIAGELKIALSDRWNAYASALWDTHDDETDRNSLRLQYHSEDDFIVNMSYRYRSRDLEPVDSLTGQRGSLEQTDLSVVLPINDNWRAVARWNYNLQEDRDLELLGGIEYDTCCWKLRVAGRRYNQNADGDYNTGIELQLVLKGLGQIGSPLGRLLERGIRGYDDRDDEYF